MSGWSVSSEHNQRVSMVRAATLTREALRLHERYLVEFVERFGLCPWAKTARQTGRTRRHVITTAFCEPSDLQLLLAAWRSDPQVEVAFVIRPLWNEGRAAFERWAESVATLLENDFVMAPFYPGAQRGSVRFLRQTPDPTVQLVRTCRLAAVRAHEPPHYADIFELPLRDLCPGSAAKRRDSVYETNERVIAREGRAAMQSILDDICADRDKTYASLWRGHAEAI